MQLSLSRPLLCSTVGVHRLQIVVFTMHNNNDHQTLANGKGLMLVASLYLEPAVYGISITLFSGSRFVFESVAGWTLPLTKSDA